MSTSTNTQDIFRRILKTREEAYQLLNLIQKIAADMASEKEMNVKDYLDVLEQIFNSVPTFLVLDNVPLPDETPLPNQGQWYDIGIGADGSLWWKNITGWEKIWSPVLTVNLIKGETEKVSEFPQAGVGDVIYTPKGSVYQYTKEENSPGEWRLIHEAYLTELHSIANGDGLQDNFGKDGDIAIDHKLRVYQKNGTWILKATLNTYTKNEIDSMLNPQTVEETYNGIDRDIELPVARVKGVFSVHINQTPIFLGRGYTISQNIVTITYQDIWEGDIVTVVFI